MAVSTLTCPGCGAPLALNSTSCNYCGATVVGTHAATAPGGAAAQAASATLPQRARHDVIMHGAEGKAAVVKVLVEVLGRLESMMEIAVNRNPPTVMNIEHRQAEILQQRLPPLGVRLEFRPATVPQGGGGPHGGPHGGGPHGGGPRGGGPGGPRGPGGPGGRRF